LGCSGPFVGPEHPLDYDFDISPDGREAVLERAQTRSVVVDRSAFLVIPDIVVMFTPDVR
jgi:hypothetical protein